VAVTVEFAAATDGAAVNGVLRGLTFTKP